MNDMNNRFAVFKFKCVKHDSAAVIQLELQLMIILIFY